MYTDCPACSRQFNIRAEHLSAADGEVKCGYCGEQFNALERLHDKPRPVKKPTVPVVNAEQSVDPEPEFYIPEIEESDAEEMESAPENINRQDQEPLYSVPEELLQEPSGKQVSWFKRLLWFFIFTLLILATLGQFAWFNRDELLSRYPELMPWARKLCDRLQCEVIRFHDVSAIKLLNRDVREHPRYEEALLVNATMVNRAKIIQPFPKVQLGLFDTNGKLIAYRLFSPEDYLDNSINIKNGMMPDTPVHFVLEVTGQTKGAVSFEFRFL